VPRRPARASTSQPPRGGPGWSSRMVVWPKSRGCTRTPRTIFTPDGGPRGPSSAASGHSRRLSFSSRHSVTVGSSRGTPRDSSIGSAPRAPPTSVSVRGVPTRRRPPSSGRCWTSRTSCSTRRPSVNAFVPATPTDGTAKVGSGPPSRWRTTRRAPRSPRIFAPSTSPTPRTSLRLVATVKPVGAGLPRSQRRVAPATPGVGPSRPLLPR